MDATKLTDDACERILSGRLTFEEAEFFDVGWFLEDVRHVFCRPLSPAARSLHPSSTGRPAGAPPLQSDEEELPPGSA